MKEYTLDSYAGGEVCPCGCRGAAETWRDVEVYQAGVKIAEVRMPGYWSYSSFTEDDKAEFQKAWDDLKWSDHPPLTDENTDWSGLE